MKKFLKRFSILLAILSLIGGVYLGYKLYQLEGLTKMTFEETLAYTTKDNKEAVITVGIIKDGQMAVTVYGANATELPTEDHDYEIGSLTKTFTTSLLAKAIDEGEVSLDDSLADYLAAAKQDSYPSLKELVTHTSGYKNYYFQRSIFPKYLRGENILSDISKDQILATVDRTNTADKNYPFVYSNFGLATLGLVLEDIYQEDYTELVNYYVKEDLGLANTHISTGQGDLSNYWYWAPADGYIPAGAMISNITDMMAYLEMQIHEEQPYFAMMQQPIVETDATNAIVAKTGLRYDAVGIGWMIDQENNIVWHNGGTGYYNAYLGFDKDQEVGVVVLSNLPPSYRIPASVMGLKLLTSLQD